MTGLAVPGQILIQSREPFLARVAPDINDEIDGGFVRLNAIAARRLFFFQLRSFRQGGKSVHDGAERQRVEAHSVDGLQDNRIKVGLPGYLDVAGLFQEIGRLSPQPRRLACLFLECIDLTSGRLVHVVLLLLASAKSRTPGGISLYS